MKYLRTSSIALLMMAHCAFSGCGGSESSGTGTNMDEIASQLNSTNPAVQQAQQQNFTRLDGKPVTPGSFEDIPRILAPREVEVEVLGVKASEEINRINERMTESIQKNNQWFIEYVKAEARTGKALPYHVNFGITEDEYNRYLGYLQSFKLVPMKKGRLKFTAQTASRTLIGNLEGLPEYDGIVVDVEQNQVETRWGTATVGKPIHASDASALGLWDGYGWNFQQGSADTGSGTMIMFDVGRQTESSMNVMRIRALSATNGVKTVDQETIVRFP